MMVLIIIVLKIVITRLPIHHLLRCEQISSNHVSQRIAETFGRIFAMVLTPSVTILESRSLMEEDGLMLMRCPILIVVSLQDPPIRRSLLVEETLERGSLITSTRSLTIPIMLQIIPLSNHNPLLIQLKLIMISRARITSFHLNRSHSNLLVEL